MHEKDKQQQVSISGDFLGHVAAQHEFRREEIEFFADALTNTDPTVKPRYHVVNVHLTAAYSEALEEENAEPGQQKGWVFGPPLDLQAYLLEAAEIIGAHSDNPEDATRGLVEFAREQLTLEEEIERGMAWRLHLVYYAMIFCR